MAKSVDSLVGAPLAAPAVLGKLAACDSAGRASASPTNKNAICTLPVSYSAVDAYIRRSQKAMTTHEVVVMALAILNLPFITF